MNQHILKLVGERFAQKFSTSPQYYFSPGRINLIGEHVDYNDGFVMPAAINKGVYYAIAANDSERINFYSIDFDEDYTTSIHVVSKQSGWKNYVLSVVNEFLIAGKSISGFDCVFAGDVPRGSGMSSSAAVEGGLAFALNQLFAAGFNRKQLALLCQRAEHNFPNVKCGIMDQYANMFGKEDHVLMLDCRSVEHEYLPLELSGYEIVLVNSKVHHSLAGSEYNQRRQQCEAGLAMMRQKEGINSFRDLSLAILQRYEAEMPEQMFNCCSYVVQEIDRTQSAAIYLQQNALPSFGALMYETHWGLSKLYKVSCKELDYLVDVAQQHPAVIGARLMGGGFGGCTINIVRASEAQQFASAVSQSYQHAFGIAPEIYFVKTGDGTRQVTAAN